MRLGRFGVAGLLAVAVLAAHSGALRGGFHYDDMFAIVENPAVRSWQPALYVGSSTAVISETEAAGYRPLTVASFAINYRLGALNPVGYLGVNLALHLAIAWMVFVLGVRLLGDARSSVTEDRCFPWAAVAALLFALHPVNAEAVNYIVARSSLLSTLGALVAFWGWLRWRGGEGGRWLAVGVGSFAAALLSKESAVALLIPLAAYEWMGIDSASSVTLDRCLASSVTLDRCLASRPGGRAFARSVVRLAPFVVTAGLFVGVWAMMTSGGISARGAAAYPAWTLAEIVGRSLLLWVWPWPLGLDHPLVFTGQFDPVLAIALGLAGAGVGAAWWVARRRHPLSVWLVAWVLAGFAPLAPLPWITTQGLLQENRMAFSAVGLAWLTAVAVRSGVVDARSRFGAFPVRGSAVVVGGVALLGAVAADRARSAVWNDDRRVWEEVVRRSPKDLVARINLGSAYMDREEFDRAEAEFNGILAVAPNYTRAYYNLGLLALRRDRYEEARGMFLHTAALAPQDADVYHILGAEALKRKHLDDARAAFEQAVALNPRDAKAHVNLGRLALQSGDASAAESSYLAALRADPRHAKALNDLGAIYLQRREWSRALEPLTAALQRDPESIEALYNRAVVLVGLGRRDEARAALQVVLAKLPPDLQFDPYRRGARYLLDGGEP